MKCLVTKHCICTKKAVMRQNKVGPDSHPAQSALHCASPVKHTRQWLMCVALSLLAAACKQLSVALHAVLPDNLIAKARSWPEKDYHGDKQTDTLTDRLSQRQTDSHRDSV